MRKFIEEYEWEVLLILTAMIAITRSWVPPVVGFEKVYCASQWALSYDYGLIRRGLVGTIFQWWTPFVTIQNVHDTALAAYYILLLLLLVVSFALLRYKEKGGRLFRLMMIFVVTPATLSLFANDIGRFDLFLVIIVLLAFILLALRKFVFLIPLLTIVAMFIHEGFLVLWVPTIVAALLFVYVWEKKDKKILTTLVATLVSVAGAFIVLYKLGDPTKSYEEFSSLVQSRAAFQITDLSVRECYYALRDHLALTVPYLRDVGSMLNFLGALVILSPVILILANLWVHALENCGGHRAACWLLMIATLSGLILLPIATDFGRWLSAVITCNFFAIFFLVNRGIIKVEELTEYSGGSFSLLFVLLVVTYLLFGPLHDWNPYPYQDSLLYSSLAMIPVVLFDVLFFARWRSVGRRPISD